MRHRAPPWSARENAIVQRARSPTTAFRRLRGKRTIDAIVQRRYQLRVGPEEAVTLRGGNRRLWTDDELAILKACYPFAKRMQDVQKALPRPFTRQQIRSKVHKLGLKRIFTGSVYLPKDGHFDLVDQIRLRAKADGIPFRRLDQELKTRGYFGNNWNKTAHVNLRYVALAVEFFGGTLVIDWRDRIGVGP